MSLIEVESAIAGSSKRVDQLQCELKTTQAELEKLRVERCRLLGQKLCVCGKEPVAYTCFACGARIGECCVGYCNEEDMAAACAR